MKRVSGYCEEVEFEGNTYTVTVIKRNAEVAGEKCDEYTCYLSNESGFTKEMFGLLVETTPTFSEAMEIAIGNVYDYVGELDRIERFENILDDYIDEIDSRKRRWKAFYAQNQGE